MKANLLPIGRMARINHVTVATLRLYDRMGLLKPAFIDPISGYRYYDIQQNARLDMIAYMKELGMSLKEIQGVLEADRPASRAWNQAHKDTYYPAKNAKRNAQRAADLEPVRAKERARRRQRRQRPG